MLICI